MGRVHRLTLCALAVASLATAERAYAGEPSNERLVLTGLALAPPTYLLGVTLHEGSHALAAKLVGGTVDQVRLFPPGVDPRAGTFRFGWVYVRGLRTRAQRQFFYLAPKITDAVLLSAYSALVLTDHLPSSRYGTLALTVVATGLWIDFAKDVVLFSRHNDVVKALHLWCMRGWKQVPARLVYAGISAGFAYVVARGYERTFGGREIEMTTARDGAGALALPIFSARF
jgi:hypothetical protein